MESPDFVHKKMESLDFDHKKMESPADEMGDEKLEGGREGDHPHC